MRPWKYNPDWQTKGGWWHLDQNAFRPGQSGKCCIQGLVTFLDATAETGGICVIPGSHHCFEDVCHRSLVAHSKGAFIPVLDGDPILKDGGILICAKAGDMILWDSRTVHCNTPALMPQEDQGDLQKETTTSTFEDDNPPQLIRQVAYVCMTPARWATKEVIRARQEAFVKSMSTSHWPHTFTMAGVALPGTPFKDLTSISREQRRLIGFSDSIPHRCSLM